MPVEERKAYTSHLRLPVPRCYIILHGARAVTADAQRGVRQAECAACRRRCKPRAAAAALKKRQHVQSGEPRGCWYAQSALFVAAEC